MSKFEQIFKKIASQVFLAAARRPAFTLSSSAAYDLRVPKKCTFYFIIHHHTIKYTSLKGRFSFRKHDNQQKQHMICLHNKKITRARAKSIEYLSFIKTAAVHYATRTVSYQPAALAHAINHGIQRHF